MKTRREFIKSAAPGAAAIAVAAPAAIAANALDAPIENDSREAFMAAIVKLADDAAFRRSFLTHYQLWLHPPMMVVRDPESGCIGGGLSLQPGSLTYMTEEQIASLNRVAPDGYAARRAALDAVLSEPGGR